MGVFYIFLGVAVLFLLYKWLFEGKLGPALFEWDSSKITFLFEKSDSGTELVLRRGEIFPKKFNIPLGNDTPEHYSLFVAEKDIAQFLSNNHQGYGTVVAAKLLEVQKWKKMLIRLSSVTLRKSKKISNRRYVKNTTQRLKIFFRRSGRYTASLLCRRALLHQF